uniref:RRM domain-containing protein n=1 Tax=Trypanosoma congolense (strain IL3000) TaxID=1068625 RepID=G0URG6_TRYCI|nr:hypothetical protein, unlikely [Trypanosoma congolense IL3000]
MFSLRDILSQLPPDDATRWIRVENVVSPMSSAEVLKLFPDAVSWEFLSNVRRTNFVITFRNESYARKAMQRACGLSYLGEKLILSYATAAQSSSATQPARVTTSQPFLYLLPPEFSYESRLTEADRMIASLDAMDSWNSGWVDAC